jgi:hypothetical protein
VFDKGMRQFNVKRVALAVAIGVAAVSLGYAAHFGLVRIPRKAQPNRRWEVLAECRSVEAQSGPVYTFGNHNVTYYCWKKEIAKGRMPAKGNSLVHVDAHDDLFGQRIDPEIPLPQPTNDQDRWAYATARTDIGNWLLPCHNDGIINHIYWVVPRWEGESFAGTHHARKLAKMSKQRSNPGGLKLDILRLQELSDCPVPKKALLTVDLDWFSCLLRVNLSSHVASPEEIQRDAEALAKTLAQIGLKPPNITIANSPMYCPRDQWQMIQEELLSALRRHGVIPSQGG